ncbi:MAG: AAA family ATPase [gamma proteobacterium endosymbiont of Lamellibrachia anaximandri]|nr:AAA family ATPase [gamma proteobacterium endosymbiont of Lamellibrachia anaximandri]MBL3532912.1 AAA family ATPase [gamma proteobacterium endosymbiont of Lamellibrachia anaximandri]
MTTARKNLAKVDHRVYKTWLKVLFRTALSDNTEWQRRMRIKPDEDIIELFAKYIERVVPVIAIESSLPYAEHLLIELIGEHVKFNRPVFLPSLLSGHWQTSHGKPFEARTPLVLSFHESQSVENSLMLVHGIETSDNPVLIGCNRLNQLPLEFHRLIDITLSLPVASALHFEQIFEDLFEEKLPSDSTEDGRWHNFVLPTDIQPPLRLGHSAGDAASYIRARVTTRLSRLDVEDAPSLEELHGLGAAREIALDMKRDIQLALDGHIDWSDVDRGILLAGPPGTGKTTLAMAIAKDCGIKFIAASASKWQSGSGLGEHLALIRESFEEARRFAPSILFIDEIDSIGNREKLDSHGLTYQATVINYLLEQLDGFSGRGDIIVIGATNYADSIDPALRRAGRLDQVVDVGYPTVRALVGIYNYHLKELKTAGKLAADVDGDALAQVSFGLTGADVEFFVRGAARRARKRKDIIRQDDLMAEIMRRPRSKGLSEPFDSKTIQRLAVHEAGHVVMRLLGKNKGKEISYVSIAPRSDGRIGYTAAFDDERVSMTSEDYLHEIRILLAGRAAEEVIFGINDVSDMAGKYDSKSDLSQAVNMLHYINKYSGLGELKDIVFRFDLTQEAMREHEQHIDRKIMALYTDLVDEMERSKPLIMRIADRLADEQVLDGSDIERLAQDSGA